MRTVVFAVVLFGAVGVATESQPPAPTPAKTGQAPQQESGHENSEAKTETNISGQPVTITVGPSPRQQQTNEPNQARTEQNQNTPIQWWSIGPTIAIAFFTLGLLGIGGLQYVTYREMLATTKAIERASVSLESLDILRGETTSDRTVIIGLKNSGRSPARIVAANVSFWAIEATETENSVTLNPAKDLPDVPQYFDRQFSPPAMLVAGEVSRWDYPVQHLTDHDFAVLVLAPGDKRRLWIYGYVHYADPLTPNQVRKYGWAREYDPIRSQQTKVFKFRHFNKPGYNYAD